MIRYCYIFSLIAGLLVFAGGCSTGHRIEFVPGDSKIDVMVEGRVFTSYLYSDGLAKPILFPVNSPSGVMVNRGFPLMEIKGESRDHPHHKGLWFAYRKVNDDDFWLDPASPAHIEHIEVTKMVGGAGQGELSTVLHWVGKDGEILLIEKRDMVFNASEDEYTIDFNIELTAQDKKVVFSDDKDGMFAVHVADWLKEAGASGEYFNSNGERGAKNTWGRRARWVCLQGLKNDRIIGIAIFNHPSSVNYPAYWHTRDYGLFSVNPLGRYVFEKALGVENPKKLNFSLEPGQSAHFKFRFIVYENGRAAEQLERRFREFAK